MNCSHFLFPLRVLQAVFSAFLLLNSPLLASSTIWDGVIEEGTDSSIRARLNFSPYSSIQGLLDAMTYKDGTYDTKWFSHAELGMLTTNSKVGAWYIDETPVPYEAVRPFLVRGQRFAAFENRSLFYFTHIPTRNHGSKLGYVNAVGEDFIVIERPQTNSGDWGSGGYTLSRNGTPVGFNFDDFPNREHTVVIEANARVMIEGATYPWKGWVQPAPQNLASLSGLNAANSVLVQEGRKMRVELDLPNWGNWSELVNDRAVDPVGGDQRQLRGNFYGVMMSDSTEVRTIQDSPYHWPTFPEYNDRNTFPAWLLNGGPEDPGGPVYRGIYEDNPHAVIDGHFTQGRPFWNDWLAKGRHYVAATRRVRSDIGSFIMSSENPLAFGEITAINGNEITLSAPLITHPDYGTVAASGLQVITLDADAEYFHLGARIQKEGVLKVGQLVKVWAPRPQTILFNKPLGTNPLNVQVSGAVEEGAGDITFAITRAGDASGALSIPVLLSGDAVAADFSVSGVTGYDSGTNSGTVDFADGVATVHVTLTPATDTAVEGNESVTLTLQSGSGYTLIHASDTTHILDADSDDAPVITLVSPTEASATHGLYPAAMQLGVTATDDNNTAITYAWSEVSGPGTVSFGDDSAAMTSATFSTDGEYVVRVTATDAGLNSSSVDLTVKVLPANTSPTADIWFWENYFTSGPTRVLLSAHEASDPDDDELMYTWDFGDGSSLEGRRVYHEFAPGTYTVTLRVDDGRGGTDQTQIPVVVDPDPSLTTWEETFDEWANGTTSDTGATPWSASGANMSVQDGKLQSFDSVATWTSGPIDISLGKAMVLMDVASSGNLEVEDTVLVSYRINGGAWTEHQTLSKPELEDLDGVGKSYGVIIPGLIGSSVELRVRIETSRTNEMIELDKVRVLITSGEPRLSVSVSGTANEWNPQGVDFVIDRILNTSDAFTANFSLGGTSVGADYTVTGATTWDSGSQTGTVQFSGGELQKTITVTPINDSLTEGTETLQLTLQSGTGYTLGVSTAQVDILDAQTNYAPFITRVNPTEGSLSLASENEAANLEISAGDDRSAVLTYQWSKVSGPGTVTFSAETSGATSADFSSFGEYVIRVTVTDGDNLAATQDYAVTVIDSLNTAPTAVISSDVVAGSAPLRVAFVGTGSSDPDGDTLSYSWDFGDGNSSTEASPSHTYSSQGVYNARLTVSDGRTGSDTTTVVINVAAPAAPGNIIWQETFAGLANGSTVDNGDTAWSLDKTTGALSVLNGELHGSNLDSVFTWTSEAMDISGGTANFTVDLKTPPTTQLEDSDLLRVKYILDGGAPILSQEYIGRAIGDNWITMVQGNLQGNSLQIVIEVINSSGAEHHMIDNITVRVEAPANGYHPGVFNGWMAALPPEVMVEGSLQGFSERANGQVQNGLLFALGINSLNPADALGKLPWHSIKEEGGNQYLVLHFRRRVGGSGTSTDLAGYVADQVRYIVECSTDLTQWDTGAVLLEEDGSEDNGDGTFTQRVRLKQRIADDADGKEFLRLRVEPL